jgi:predicted MFS family arabinose efflux permease
MVAESSKPMSRQLFLAIAVAIAVDGALYSAVVPQLPALTKQFSLSASAAGLLTSGYSGGLVVGSLAAIPLLRRLSARIGVLCGLVAFGASTALFATAWTSPLLMVSRVGQGLSAGVLWTACMVWLLDTSAPQRRGATLGRALSFTFVGTIGGPTLGTLATQIGRPAAYLTMAVICLLVAVWVAVLPVPASYSDPDTVVATELLPTARRAARIIAALGAGVAVFSGLSAGVLSVVAPLRLSALGATDLRIGAIFIVAAAATGAVSLLGGQLVDRFGAARPLGVCCTVLAILFGVTPALGSVLRYAAAVIVLLAVGFVGFVAGQTAMTRCGEVVGWPLRFITAVAAITWGVGETIGAALGGAGLQHWGLITTMFVTAAITVLTLVAVVGVALTQPGAGFQRGLPAPEPAKEPCAR